VGAEDGGEDQPHQDFIGDQGEHGYNVSRVERLYMTYALAFIVVGVALMSAFWQWAYRSGEERKEQGKPNWARPVVVGVVGAMALIVIWAALTGN
jgi:heme/copper-type cytochrome/quinol oxidase subunit 2